MARFGPTSFFVILLSFVKNTLKLLDLQRPWIEFLDTVTILQVLGNLDCLAAEYATKGTEK